MSFMTLQSERHSDMDSWQKSNQAENEYLTFDKKAWRLSQSNLGTCLAVQSNIWCKIIKESHTKMILAVVGVLRCCEDAFMPTDKIMTDEVKTKK